MKKITKLLFSELLLNFILTYLAFFTILFSIEFVDKIDDLVTLKIGLFGTLNFFLLRIPYIHSLISLYATVISIMITLNILSQKNEITALLSSGVSIKRIFMVFLSFVIVISTLTFYNDNYISPKLSYKSETMLKKGGLDNDSKLSDILFKSKDGFIFVNLFVPEKNILLNTYIVNLGENLTGIETVFFAKVISKEREGWKAKEATIYDYKTRQSKLASNVVIPEFDFFKNIGKHSFKYDWLSIKEILKIIHTASKSGIDVRNFYFQLVIKTINFMAFFLIFYLIFPFGFQLGRNKKNVEIIFVGIIILLCYTVFKTFILKIFRTSGINPFFPVFLILIPLLGLGLANWKKHFS